MRRVTMVAMAAAASVGIGGFVGAHASGSAATTLRVKADAGGGLKFDKKRLHAAPGPGHDPHEEPERVREAARRRDRGPRDRQGRQRRPAGRALEGHREAQRGTYTFYCPVDGHEAAGMKGTLTSADPFCPIDCADGLDTGRRARGTVGGDAVVA